MDIRAAIDLAERLVTPQGMNQARKELAIEYRQDMGGMETLIYDFCRDTDYDEDRLRKVKSIFRVRGFMAWFKDYLDTKLEDAEWEIEHRIQGNRIKGYRVITAPADWKLEGHPGIYWSWDESAAQAHWGNYGEGMIEWKITAWLPVGNIDWPRTIVMNAHHSFNEEKELRLITDAQVEILSIVPMKEH